MMQSDAQRTDPRCRAVLAKRFASTPTGQVMFVVFGGNAIKVTVDLVSRNVIDHYEVGDTRDTLAYDCGAERVYGSICAGQTG